MATRIDPNTIYVLEIYDYGMHSAYTTMEAAQIAAIKHYFNDVFPKMIPSERQSVAEQVQYDMEYLINYGSIEDTCYIYSLPLNN